MPVSTLRASRLGPATGTWGNLVNADDAGTGTYATWTDATRRGAASLGFSANFMSLAGSTINSVTVRVRHYMTSSANVESVDVTPTGGTAAALARPTAVAVSSVTIPLAEFTTASSFAFNLNIARANNTTSATYYLDWVEVDVDYTAPTAQPPTGVTARAIGERRALVWWTPVANATAYEVQRSVDAQSWASAGIVTTPYLFDTTPVNGLHYWRVLTQAYGAWSITASAQVTALLRDKPPLDLSYVAGFEAGYVGFCGGSTSMFQSEYNSRTSYARLSDLGAERVGSVSRWAYHCVPSGGVKSLDLWREYTGGASWVRSWRFYLRFQSLSSLQRMICETHYGWGKIYHSAGGWYWGWGNAAPKHQLGAVGSGGSTSIATNKWYCIDLRQIITPHTAFVEIYIDGVKQRSSVDGTEVFPWSGTYSLSESGGFTIGTKDSATFDALYDDLAASAVAEDFPIGPSAGCVGVSVDDFDAAGTEGAFQFFDGATTQALTVANEAAALAAVSAQPPISDSDPDYVVQMTPSGTAHVDLGYEPLPVAAEDIRLVRAYAGSKCNTNTGYAGASMLGYVEGMTSPAVVHSTTDAYNVEIAWFGGNIEPPPGGWTQEAVNKARLRYGYSINTAQQLRMHTGHLEVEVGSLSAAIEAAGFGIPL